ncbi:MAG: response regulator [Candidatus Competibacteraceae bacterium]
MHTTDTDIFKACYHEHIKQQKDLNYHPKVLIIDIDATNAKLIAEILGESENYRVQISINYQKALAHAQQYQPDLIILDSMIPNYNGLKEAQILKYP